MLFNSLLIIGLSRSTAYQYIPSIQDDEDAILDDTKMVFWRIRYWAVNSLGEFWSKPVITCPACMASLHSTYVYWSWATVTGIETYHIWLYLLYIPALSGMVSLINRHD